MRRKLSNKLSIVYAGLFSVMFLALSIGVLLWTYFALLEDKREYLRNTMPIISGYILEEIAEGEAITNEAVLQEQAFDLNLNILLFTPDGAILNAVRNFYMDESKLPRGMERINTTFAENGTWLLTYQSELRGDNIHYGSLMLVNNLANERNYIRLLSLLLLGANLVGVIAAALVGRFVSRRMFAPIERMIKQAAQIDSQNLTVRLSVPGPDDELKSLANTINHMLARVEDAFVQQSRFTADASHELRTPLAAIQGNIELLRRWGARDEAVLKESMDTLSRQVTYMNNLVDRMLFLAHGESEAFWLQKETFFVKPLLEEIVAEQMQMDEAHDYAVQADAETSMHADRTMIRQMLLALLHNSQKFTPEGGRIELAASAAEKQLILSVADTGIGMDETHLKHIFDRFYRVDRPRSRADGGAGLGLSIVESIAKAHGGYAEAVSEKGKGTRITVHFPK